MTTPSRPPLWREMCRAMAEVDMGANASEIYAAEIRALRDWLVPEEDEPEPGDRYKQRHIIWRHNQRLRALLTTEADRAECGNA